MTTAHPSAVPLRDLDSRGVTLWNELLAAQPQSPSPFLTYEFSRAVERARGGVFVARLEARRPALMAFQQSHRFIRTVGQKVGGSLSDCSGLVGGMPGAYGEQVLLKACGLSVYDFDHWPLSERIIPETRGRISHGLHVRFEDVDAYFAQLKAADQKFVAEVARLERQLAAKYGELEFSWHSDRAREELARVIAEKRKQYARTGVGDTFEAEWPNRLMFELLEGSNDTCEAVMSTVFCGDTWVASHFGLRHRAKLHLWFPVYNPELRRYGPGHILLFKLFRHAAARGVREIDFGEGISDYKKKYGGAEYAVFSGTLRRKNLIGTSHKVVQSLAWRLRDLRARRDAA